MSGATKRKTKEKQKKNKNTQNNKKQHGQVHGSLIATAIHTHSYVHVQASSGGLKIVPRNIAGLIALNCLYQKKQEKFSVTAVCT